MTEAIRFSSPEEELKYLRSKVEGLSSLEAVKNTIREVHSELPVAVRSSSEVKQTLERVGNKPGDTQLVEMITVTRTKGVFHALSVVEKLEDWKHEDDFHDYLVELVRQGTTLRAVDEKGPMYRA